MNTSSQPVFPLEFLCMAMDTFAVYLEQEHVLGTIAAVNGELARPLLGRDDMQLRRKCCDGDHRLACNVGARHC